MVYNGTSEKNTDDLGVIPSLGNLQINRGKGKSIIDGCF